MSDSQAHGGSRTYRSLWICPVVVAAVVLLGCTAEAFLNVTRPLGDSGFVNVDYARASSLRDDLGIGFVNRTSYRVIGTYGGYDPQDQDTVVTIGQLGVTSGLDLTPSTVSRVYGIPATRAFTVGGRQLLHLISEGDLETETVSIRAYPTTTAIAQFMPSEDLLKENLGFTGAPFGSDQGNTPTQGTAQAITVYIGSDYRHDSILIFNLVEDGTVEGGFRIDFTTARDIGVDTSRLVLLDPLDRAQQVFPLNLDHMTFHLLTALGNNTADASDFTLDPGDDPDHVKVTVSNNSGQDIGVALFGAGDAVLITVLDGEEQEQLLDPGEYDYYVIPSSTGGSIQVNTQVLNAGVAATLSLVSLS